MAGYQHDGCELEEGEKGKRWRAKGEQLKGEKEKGRRECV